jgi:RND family efflux transporter MFP subunit
VQNLISVSEAQASQPAHLEQAVWRQMQDAATFGAFAQAWLVLQCKLIAGVRRGLVTNGLGEEGPFAPIAFWPEGKGGTLGLLSAAELAIEERRGVLRDSSSGQGDAKLHQVICHIAYPLLIDGRLHGAVAIELTAGAEHELRLAMRNLQWGIGWIEARLRRTESGRFSPLHKRLASVLDLVSASVDKERFQAAATAVATDIATDLGCERASIGFLRGKHIKVSALSHSAQFTQRSNLIEQIGGLMDEAMDQRATLVYPAPEDAPVQLLRNHAKLAKAHDECALCTVPLTLNGKIVGALTLERPGEVGFDQQTVEFCEAVAAIIGPILDIRRRQDQWLVGKIWDSAKFLGRRIFGAGHVALKMFLISLAGATLFLAFATGDYRVAADTRVEGSVQRVVAAPIDGYVAMARVRAGDIVRKGEVMAQLDDRDLLLERAKWVSQQQQHLQQYRDALAKSNRADIAVLKAQLGQAEAELALAGEKLRRLRLVAPFDGLIVSGDLSHSLGSPVAQGDVMFRVAPLDAYRVILEVDERDIANVHAGKPGKLVLTGKSDAVLPFNVERITPVSEAREGRNFFRVEAKLGQTPEFLRPGMKGVGKIEVGERKLIWIWTHTLVDWFKMALWSYWP